jgi:REP element-mobilizing transposase RayT
MPTEKFRNKYRIPSARAVWHDYNGGAYFITLCTKTREHYFGEIENGTMRLSEIGECANENFQYINTHYPYAEIPLWVVMPNHVHAIVLIDDYKAPQRPCRDVACRISEKDANNGDTAHRVSENNANNGAAARHVSTVKNEQMQRISNMQGRLSVVIGGFKSAITRFARQHNYAFAWQTRFHDAIIRNQEMMNTVADYIEHNVARWEEDCFYKKGV